MRTRLPRCRPLSTRLFAIILFLVGFCIYCYYYTNSAPNIKPMTNLNSLMDADFKEYQALQSVQKLPPEQCPVLQQSSADIDTVTVYPTFDFQPSWLRTKEFWDKTFEDRYETIKTRNDTERPQLKVIVVPHSHNDPGWLKTFEQYFEAKTKDIIDNIVIKLNQYPNMTFIWTEISFLNAWWERAHPVKQKALKKLVKEGRLEITTGGWVMPDEACTHIYALIDQFIEGHTWIKTNLGIEPKTGWSIDPFGHGPTVPYLLDQSGLRGTIIQRIHYAWKQWLAQQQIEEFFWIPGWKTNKPSMIVHNQPFDIYSIKSSCGPHPSVCLSFDFRKVPGEYTEYSAKHEEITDQNLERKSKTLIEEYDRIGSLTTHNVVLVPLGDDFRYEFASEFDAQYTNYMKMFNFINSHPETFNAHVSFGTPLDYFNALMARNPQIPTLKGDFFVYSDIFSEGKPAYWSGYYTTRPYLKLLARQLEHQLRTSEILFTMIFNYLKDLNDLKLVASAKRLEKSYEELIYARRNLGLFQHHDAITGTSRAAVMYDYGTKLFTSIYHCKRLQEAALTSVMIPDHSLHTQSLIQSEVEYDTYGKPPKKLMISLIDKKKVIIFNPLVQQRIEIITLRSNTTNVRVFDTYRKQYVPYQIMPNIEIVQQGKRILSDKEFELMFEADLPPLTAVTFDLEEHTNTSNHCVVYCNKCNDLNKPDGENLFVVKEMLPGDIQLENSYMKLLINRNTGFLRQVYRKDLRKRNVFEMHFEAYQSAQRHSGAYLFMPDYDAPEKPVLNNYANSNNLQEENIIIVSGPISTEIKTLYLPFLVHTVRIFNGDDPFLSRGIFVENIVDFESPPRNRETELFMRIQTDIQNGEPPEFYTDQNGFQFQKRVLVDKLGIEANYYPITTMAWIQDEQTRLTVVTGHAQGAAAATPGRLEVMLDRRTLYDDFRGIGEGLVDNKPTKFHHWLLLEGVAPAPRARRAAHSAYELPSPLADYLSRALNYPATVYLVDSSEAADVQVASHRSFVRHFPPGVHLVALRTITDDVLDQFPTDSAYMVLHRPGLDCALAKRRAAPTHFTSDTQFVHVRVSNVTAVSLTGLHTLRALDGLHDIRIKPMEVKTFKIKF